MASQVSLGGKPGVLSAVLHSNNTAAMYTVEAGPISAYFDGYRVTPVFSNSHLDLSRLEAAVGPVFPGLEQVAVQGARRAVLAEEVRQIADGLVRIISGIYNPTCRLQVPEPKYETDADGNTLASFTAHFATCPANDDDGNAAEMRKETSAALRKRVFDRLFDDPIPGFERHN